MMMNRSEIVAKKLGLAKTELSTPDRELDWGGFRHNNGGSKRGYYCTPFFKIDVGLNEEFSMALEMFDAQNGKINRQPFGMGMFCAGRIADWREKDGKKAKEIEVWQ